MRSCPHAENLPEVPGQEARSQANSNDLSLNKILLCSPTVQAASKLRAFLERRASVSLQSKRQGPS